MLPSTFRCSLVRARAPSSAQVHPLLEEDAVSAAVSRHAVERQSRRRALAATALAHTPPGPSEARVAAEGAGAREDGGVYSKEGMMQRSKGRCGEEQSAESGSATRETVRDCPLCSRNDGEVRSSVHVRPGASGARIRNWLWLRAGVS
eukprot:4095203-Pleurochrysis_carterae.AAC.1